MSKFLFDFEGCGFACFPTWTVGVHLEQRYEKGSEERFFIERRCVARLPIASHGSMERDV